MVLKLYGSRFATCSARVEVVLIEKQIPYEFIDVILLPPESTQHTPEFRLKQPFGKVPYIDDDGFILYESRAICRYLQFTYPNRGIKLAPAVNDTKALALFEQAVSIEMGYFDPYATEAGHMLIEILLGVPFNMELFNNAVDRLSNQLSTYDVILGKQKYIGGNELTMVDLFHLPYGQWVTQAGSDILPNGPWKNVSRWWNEISSRQSWKQVQDMAPPILKDLRP
ncbi:glutathione S-transferase [Marasmius fiardii PR-910]|nr:glutathione S-transferase [Marasmius fiardii PR-910]